MFWRVEFDKVGQVVSCEQVAERARDGGLVAFVEADTRAQATATAEHWLATRRQKAREYSQRMRDGRHAKGKCTQHGAPMPCERCREKNAAHKERKRLGQLIKPRHLTAAEAMAAKRAAGEKYRRMLIDVRLVRERLRQLGPAVFTTWLDQEISKRELGELVFKRRPGRPVAAKPIKPIGAPRKVAA